VRAAGLAIAPPAPIGCHADQLASGVLVPPERVWNVIPLPAGRRRTDVSAPHTCEPGPLSSTREVNVPLGAYEPWRSQCTRTPAPKMPESLAIGRISWSMSTLCVATGLPST
jgi:hypothetical protein